MESDLECKRVAEWGKPNGRVIGCEEFIQTKANKRVLDIGGGKGRDSLYFADKGFDVTIVDGNADSLDEALKFAQVAGLKINGVVSDVSEYTLRGKYAAIVCNNLLHFLDQPSAYNLIGRMQLHTSNGGINVVQAFTRENCDKNFNFLLKEAELSGVYRDWDILKYFEYKTPIEVHGDGMPHQHSLASIVARKIF